MTESGFPLMGGDLLYLGKPLLEALDRTSCGGVILDESGQVLRINAVGERILQAEADEPTLDPDRARGALKLLLRAGPTRFRAEGDTWFVVPRHGKRQLVLHAVQLTPEPSSGPHTVVILVDLNDTPQLSQTSIQKIFGLTPAEAKLATEIARGRSLGEFASATGISMATARSQLSAVMAKTQTQRQAELVALLARISILP